MLPAIRQELGLYSGPADPQGKPTWSLHDPVRNLYFRIDWLTFEILSRWHLNNPAAILQDIAKTTPIGEAVSEDVEHVAQFLVQSELVQSTDARQTQQLNQIHQKRQSGWLMWLLHHYLFFRVPLWRPDQWLSKTQHWVSFLYRRSFYTLTGAALLVGLIQISQQWDQFLGTLVDLFSWQGAAAYFVTLILVKFAHEMGHAYTAKRMGCRVPNMGVAFLVMFPMAYTDVNDAWKLRDRRQRLMVGSAGIATELIVAAWATLFWAFLPDGPVRTAMFLLATTTWISTVFINASPFLRFDGYFLLMDWLNMPNLHSRSFALARWRLRYWLFGAMEPIPEHLPGRLQRGLIGFAFATWLYRFVVFMGIAVLVYNVFPKPLGPLLAMVELGWFIVMPIYREMKDWPPMMSGLSRSAIGNRTLILLALVLAIGFLPWDTRVTGQAVLKPKESYPLVVPDGAQVTKVLVKNGATVDAGQTLVELERVDLTFQKRAAEARSESLEWQSRASGVDDKLREKLPIITAERSRVESELKGLEQLRAQYLMTAPYKGVFHLSNPDLAQGSWVGKNERLGELVSEKGYRVETYLSESDIERLKLGDSGRFYPDSGYAGSLRVEVESIDHDATHALADPILASTHGGAIPVRPLSQALVPEGALYRVNLLVSAADGRDLQFVRLRGQVVVTGTGKSWLGSYVRNGLAILRREAGF